MAPIILNFGLSILVGILAGKLIQANLLLAALKSYKTAAEENMRQSGELIRVLKEENARLKGDRNPTGQ